VEGEDRRPAHLLAVAAAQNKTNVPLRILVVEILPKDWTAPANPSLPTRTVPELIAYAG
jgi:hypothetical protein